MSDAGDSSHGGSSFGGSVASSMRRDNAIQQQDRDEDSDDLLLQEKSHGRLMESAFAVMHGFNKGRAAESKAVAVFRVCIEFLFMFAMVFNTTISAWNIDADLWIYKAYSWLLIRLLVLPKGYATYIAVFYLISAVVLVMLLGTYAVSYLCKTSTDDRGASWVAKRVTAALQAGSMVVFSMAWVSVLDYFATMFNCRWRDWQTGPHHIFFPQQNCLAMPHLAHMAFAAVMLGVFLACFLGMAVSGCELNPLTPNYLASPLPGTMLKAMSLKACIVIVCSCLGDFDTLQPVLVFACAAAIVFTMFRTTLFYNPWVMHAKAGLWSGILFTSALMIAATRDAVTDVQASNYTWAVLYGIFPVVLATMALSALRLRIIQRPLKELRAAHLNPASIGCLRDVYRFSSVAQVEFLCRVMRVWDEDHEVDADAMAFGQFILKAGMARFPGDPFLLLMHCNMLIEAHKDTQGARTQLQLAVKSSPSLLYRYFIYVAQELAKTLRHDTGALDLESYVEFQRSYRACVRAHKLALQSQRSVWHTLLADTVDFKYLQHALDAMAAAEGAASTLYRRVLERYPENGKLLKIYGRFLEFVCRDPRAAARVYADATKLGTTDSFLSLVTGNGIGSEAGRAAIGTINEKADGVVIINASGIIMMVNTGCLKMFGYEKGELDNRNVSLLMPQPFSSRHNTFLSNYLTTGQARIMDKEQSIVALHKDRSVFPISLVVTHISGQGQDSMFMGVLRPNAAADSSVVQVWTTPGGTILCASQLFRDWFGRAGSDVAGQPFNSLGVDTYALAKFMTAATTLPPHQVANGALSLRTKLLHEYTTPIDVELTVGFAGTADNRILVLSIRCLSDSISLFVLNRAGRVTFCTKSLETMLGMTLEGKPLTAMLPEPYGHLHLSWLAALAKKVPPSSCRAGAVVHLATAHGAKIPVTLAISAPGGSDTSEFVVKVMRASDELALDTKRLLLHLDQHGIVVGASQGTPKSLYGFSPSDLIGKPLEAFLDVFDDWHGAHGSTHELLTLLAKESDEQPGVSYRVGVGRPADAGQHKAAGVAGVAGAGAHTTWTLQDALQQRDRVCPAVMQLALVLEPDVADDANGADDDASRAAMVAVWGTPVLTVQLWRADVFSCVLEVDRHLVVHKADDMAALVFGVAPQQLVRMDLKRHVSMGPQFARAEDLLRGPNAKKAAIKGATSVGPLVGAAHAFKSAHNDGNPLKLEFQAAASVAHSRSCDKMLIRVRVVEPSTGSIEAMKAISQKAIRQEKAASMTGASAATAAARQGTTQHVHVDLSSSGSSSNSSTGGLLDEEMAAGMQDASGENKAFARLRVKDWISETSCHTPTSARQQPLLCADAMCQQDGESGATAYVAIRNGGGSSGKRTPGAKRHDSGLVYDLESESAAESEAGVEHKAGRDATSDKDEDELACDWRRAKRLKKLTAMLSSPVARAASCSWVRCTCAIVAVLWCTQMAGLLVLVNQVDQRGKLMKNVADLALTTDRSQLIAFRCLVMARCHVPLFANVPSCNAVNRAAHKAQAIMLSDYVGAAHMDLYLGQPGSAPTRIPDERLYERWSNKQVPEYTLQSVNSSGVLITKGTNTLWQIGNRLVAATREVVHFSDVLNASTVNSSAYHYVMSNVLGSFYEGYTWSLDAYTSFVWDRLGSLKLMVILLLAVELGVVQALCFAYEYAAFSRCNAQHMRSFGAFLALPSANIRAMVSRPCLVDDEEAEDLDEDEAAMQAEGGHLPNSSHPQLMGKSVTLQAHTGAPRVHGSASMGATATAHASRTRQAKGLGSSVLKDKVTHGASGGLSRARTSLLYRTLTSQLQATLKINGKKLTPDRTIMYKFMVPLLCYMLLVAVIYGISIVQLAAVQRPLVALNGLAHVAYRVSRTRVRANQLAFAADDRDNDNLRARLKEENDLLRREYNTVMYGGPMLMQAEVGYDAVAPAAAFLDQAITELFFRTNKCMRMDGSTCYNSTHQFHAVTHHGLDLLISRHMTEMDTLSKAPDNMTLPSNPGIVFLISVTNLDMVPGLYTGLDLFVRNVVDHLHSVKMLHIIVMAVGTIAMGVYWCALFLPHVAKLRSHNKQLAGLLSQLPPETDVEGYVKSVVLQIRREDGSSTRNSMRAGGSSVRANNHTGQRSLTEAGHVGSTVVVVAGH